VSRNLHSRSRVPSKLIGGSVGICVSAHTLRTRRHVGHECSPFSKAVVQENYRVVSLAESCRLCILNSQRLTVVNSPDRYCHVKNWYGRTAELCMCCSGYEGSCAHRVQLATLCCVHQSYWHDVKVPTIGKSYDVRYEVCHCVAMSSTVIRVHTLPEQSPMMPCIGPPLSSQLCKYP
jgi:hypothetical protein